MDYQTNQNSGATWYIVGVVVVIAVLALWYFYPAQTQNAGTESSAVEQVQTQPLSSGNTTADISADLNQTTNGSALLDQDAAASAAAVSSF